MSQDSIREKPERLSPQQAFRRKWLEAENEPRSTRVNPYPGLRSFNVDEAHIFRARVNQTTALRKTFAGASFAGENRHVIMVVGGSSSGKSSIVKAGLLAKIHSLQMPDGDGNWYIVESRPVQEPMQELLRGLTIMIVEMIFARLKSRAKDQGSALKEALDALGIAGANISSDPAEFHSFVSECVRALLDERLWSTRHQQEPKSMAPALALFVKGPLNSLDLHLYPLRAGPPRLLLSIDQFEEIFRSPIGPERNAIFELIRFADQAQRQGARELYIVASMRSEELHRCSELQGLSDIVNRSIHLVELVLRDDAKLAVVEPGRFTLQGYGVFPVNRDANWPYTQCAVDAIVDAYGVASDTVEHRADALSLLQHFLRLLWERTVGNWVKSGSKDDTLLIDLDALSAISGWDAPVSSRTASVPTSADKAGEAQHRLASVLNYRADAVYNRAIQVWCDATRDWSEATKALARSVLKAAFVSLARRDDQRRVVRDWQTITGMLAVSGAAERFAQTAATAMSAADAAAYFMAHFEKPLAAALCEFERATLVERRADATADGRPGSDKYTVYHEAFIRNWGQYADWVREAGKAAETLRSIYEELILVGQEPSRPDGHRPEDIITAGREADLSAVIGGTDEGVEANELTAADCAAGGDATEIQRGWASRTWVATEIARAAKAGERFEAALVLAGIRDARRAAVIARASLLELEARALKATAEAAKASAQAAEADRRTAEASAQAAEADRRTAEASAQAAEADRRTAEASAQAAEAERRRAEAATLQAENERRRAVNRSRWAAAAILVLVGVSGWLYHLYSQKLAITRQNVLNWSRYQIQAIGLIGFAATEISAGTSRSTNQDRDLWLSLNALEPTGDAVEWPSDDTTTPAEREKMRAKIVHRARQSLADLTFVPDTSAFFAEAPANDKGAKITEAKCLSDTKIVEIKGEATKQVPASMQFRIEKGTLEYATGNMDFSQVNNVQPGLDPATVVCVAPDATALLVLTTRNGRPWIFVVLTQWNKAKSRWYLQTSTARETQSWSSGALLQGNPVEPSGKVDFYRKSPVVGFLVRNRPLSKEPFEQTGVLWTNEGFSTPVLSSKLIADKAPTPKCEKARENGGKPCLLEVKSPKGDLAASYVVFDGANKACVADAEYCQMTIRISKPGNEPFEFSYQGRLPKNFAMDDDYLWIQGDDDITRSFDRRAQTAKELLALRWRHLSCKLSSDVLSTVTRNDDYTGAVPKFYDQKKLPNFVIENCPKMATGGK